MTHSLYKQPSFLTPTQMKWIVLVCRSNGIPKLVKLLRHEHQAVTASAAGALQNVAREVASRMIICDMDCIHPLADLLSSPDMHAQVCAAGALLNVIGPSLELRSDGQRRAMCKIMSLAVALSAVYEGCFDQRPNLQIAWQLALYTQQTFAILHTWFLQK